MQSVIEANDLSELLDLAQLADRDFAGNRGEAVVVMTGPVTSMDNERNKRERMELEERHRHRLRVPRRPHWTPSTTPEELDLMERRSFLEWRRDLAKLEEEERLTLTPFEKNLEVWRQLWRVVERSDIVVQVVDARDPLRYRCEDLERYCLEIDATRSTVLLLNKSDLLPLEIRTEWADYLDDLGVEYVFWSAARAMVDVDYEKVEEKAESMGLPVDPITEAAYVAELQRREADESPTDHRTHILDRDELIEYLEQKAIAALQAAGPEDPRNLEEGRRRAVGLIGYPNVGKSSTINSLFGGKKTAVAPMPGKTKHFQTLQIHDTMLFVDAPGLVFPTYAHSKAEMVAAGVIPIDRLTDVRAPIQVVADRVGRGAFEKAYGCRIPEPKVEGPVPPPTAGEVLRALCVHRGWVNGSSIPDETRGGRQILKDYVDGKLLYFEYPPGYTGPRDHLQKMLATALAEKAAEKAAKLGASSSAQVAAERAAAVAVAVNKRTGEEETSGEAAGPSQEPILIVKGDLDLESALLMESLEGAPAKSKPRRPDFKFQKKLKRSKDLRGKGAFGITTDGAFDGGGIQYGKRGGIMKVGGYAQTGDA